MFSNDFSPLQRCVNLYVNKKFRYADVLAIPVITEQLWIIINSLDLVSKFEFFLSIPELFWTLSYSSGKIYFGYLNKVCFKSKGLGQEFKVKSLL